MKVSEVIERLKTRPQDQEVVLFVVDNLATQLPVQGVGSVNPENGEPEKTAIMGFSAPVDPYLQTL